MSDYKEGDERTVVEQYRRLTCDNCGEPATKRVTYLLHNCRSNPASRGYRRDDVSWCSDAEAFACDSCSDRVEQDAPDGMKWCATFDGARFPHMICHWEVVSRTDQIAATTP